MAYGWIMTPEQFRSWRYSTVNGRWISSTSKLSSCHYSPLTTQGWSKLLQFPLANTKQIPKAALLIISIYSVDKIDTCTSILHPRKILILHGWTDYHIHCIVITVYSLLVLALGLNVSFEIFIVMVGLVYKCHFIYMMWRTDFCSYPIHVWRKSKLPVYEP